MSMQAGPVKMTVEPEEVLRLKTRLEAVRKTVEIFIRDNSDALRGKPLAEDDVSQDAAVDFAANADSAVDVARQFVDQLTNTILSLKDAAATYQLVDDTHATAMQQLAKDR
jgi:methyl-accepting chemotaxis protein